MQNNKINELKKWFDEELENVVYNILAKERFKIREEYDFIYILSRALMTDEYIMSNKLLRDNESIEILFKRIDKEYPKIVEEVRSQLDDLQLKAIILNLDEVKNFNIENKGSRTFIQKGLRNLANELLNIKEDDVILQAYCDTGSYIVDTVANSQNSKIIAIDINTNNILTSQIKASIIIDMYQNKDIKIIQRSYLNMPVEDLYFNKIFSMPPINLRLRGGNIEDDKNLVNLYEKERFSLYSDWIYVLKATLNCNLDKAIFIVSTSILFHKRDSTIRKYLFENGFIEAIIELPQKTLLGTNTSTSMVVISKNNKSIRFIDASEMYKKDRYMNVIDDESLNKIMSALESESEYSKIVSEDELLKNKYSFLPKIYVNENIDLENYQYLGEIATIKRGYANIKQDELEERISDCKTNDKILTASDINDDLNLENLTSLKFIGENESGYCVEDQDIVISRGGGYKSLLIRKNDENIMVNGTLYVISCDKEKINPYYLQMYLSSDHCLSQINMLNFGTVVPFISISQLREIKIPKISKELEEVVANKYKTILAEYEEIRIKKKNLENKKKDLEKEIL